MSEPRPDLILLDIVMPDMDGFEVLRRLSADEATRDISVIFVTAMHNIEDEQRGFELGAADFIHKPIRETVVLSRIRAQLDAKAARDMLRKTNLRLSRQMAEGAHALERAQQLLLQSEKMAAVGLVAAGVAHEINNPVGFVGSNLRTLGGYLQDLLTLLDAYAAADDAAARARAQALARSLNYEFLRQDIGDLIAESRDGIDRVSRIVQALKTFSHAGDGEWQWADLHQGLETTLNIVWNELKYHCTVTRRFAELPPVYCLPSQLNQVFMNLLVNAAHAIEGQGEITVATERVGDDAVRVSISDTGKGIAPELRERIFDPFFTTKPVGKGTGLGLALVRDIVHRHGGDIAVDSEPGRGTTFALTLPVQPVATEPPAAR